MARVAMLLVAMVLVSCSVASAARVLQQGEDVYQEEKFKHGSHAKPTLPSFPKPQLPAFTLPSCPPTPAPPVVGVTPAVSPLIPAETPPLIPADTPAIPAETPPLIPADTPLIPADAPPAGGY